MIAGLRQNGVEVVECQVPLWQGEADRVAVASGGWLSLTFVWRVFRTYIQLLWQYFHLDDYDVLILGYPGHIDVFLAWGLAKLRKKPLVWDVFMSLYLIATERGLVEKYPLTGKILHGLEKRAYALPDLLVQDTAAYVQWFEENFLVNPSRFCLVPTGADDRFFTPGAAGASDDTLFRVLYHGTFIPNHGVQYIVEAANILQNEQDIYFEFVGDGPTKAQAVALAEQYDLENVGFTGWVDKQDVPGKIARADVCLGAFGTTPQSLMTIQNKIYEGLAMGKPVISGTSPAVCLMLKHGEHVVLCQRESAPALVEAIKLLRNDPALLQTLSTCGYDLYQRKYTVSKLGAQFKQCLVEGLFNATR